MEPNPYDILMEAILSPCIGVCELDEHQICRGCLRSMEEIALWGQMDPQRREEIMERIDRQEELRID